MIHQDETTPGCVSGEKGKSQPQETRRVCQVGVAPDDFSEALQPFPDISISNGVCKIRFSYPYQSGLRAPQVAGNVSSDICLNELWIRFGVRNAALLAIWRCWQK